MTKKHGWDESHYEYNSGSESYNSFWKTIVESPEWRAWEKEVSRRLHTDTPTDVYDVDECRECGWFSPSHFKAFLNFIQDEGKTLKVFIK